MSYLGKPPQLVFCGMQPNVTITERDLEEVLVDSKHNQSWLLTKLML